MFLFRKKPSNKNNESNVFETKDNDIAISKKDDDKPKVEKATTTAKKSKIPKATVKKAKSVKVVETPEVLENTEIFETTEKTEE